MCSYANFSLRPLIAMILAVMMLDSLQHHPRDSMHWHRQLDTSWCISSIWIAFINTPWNTSGEKKNPALLLHKKKKKSIFFPSAALFFRVPRGTKQPSPQRTRAAVIRGRLGSHESSCQAEIASLFTHCFCPKLPFWVCDWVAAMSSSQRCGRCCDMAKLLT